MRKRILGAVLPLFLLMSCQTGMIRADSIDGAVNRVADRHDAYVRDDDSLSDDEKSIYLRTTELLRRLLAEAQKTR